MHFNGQMQDVHQMTSKPWPSYLINNTGLQTQTHSKSSRFLHLCVLPSPSLVTEFSLSSLCASFLPPSFATYCSPSAHHLSLSLFLHSLQHLQLPPHMRSFLALVSDHHVLFFFHYDTEVSVTDLQQQWLQMVCTFSYHPSCLVHIQWEHLWLQLL